MKSRVFKLAPVVTGVLLGLALSSGAALAKGDDDNLQKLGAFKTTGAPAMKTVEQNTKYAENLRKMLKNITLPDGFSIELFAVVPDARQMAVSRNKATVWVGTRKTTVWSVTDRDMDNIADTVQEFSPSVKFDNPAGVCYSPDGFLFVGERNRVLMFPAAEFSWRDLTLSRYQSFHRARLFHQRKSHTTTRPVSAPLVLTDGSTSHWDNRSTSRPAEKVDLYRKVGIGGIVSYKADGSDRRVEATGVRNSVGLAFNPKDKSLWFTDNQVDGMGDDTPPGELNRAPKMGMWYGHPYTGGGEVRTNEYKDQQIPKELAAMYVKPQIETIAHAADLGMNFYTGDMFPKKYHGAIFSVQHGSWNSVKPKGPRVMVTYLDSKGNASKMEPFADGFMNKNGVYLGRPADVAMYVDGSLLVADDKAGAIYRISYNGK